MFYHFLYPLTEYVSFFRLFQYITFRTIFATLTALIFVLIFGRFFIRWLVSLKFREEIRTVGPETHKKKAGTPTMGGIMILAAVAFSLALWGNFSNHYFVTALIGTLVLGFLGFADDYVKSILKRKGGLSAKMKFAVQISVGVAVSLIILFFPSNQAQSTTLYIPFINAAVLDFSKFHFLGDVVFNLSWVWVIFATAVITGYSNAVNFTDGLDGLAAGSFLIVATTLAIMTYLTGHADIAKYLRIPHIKHAAELTVLLGAFLGATLGFLWYNANPAEVFMGDTGSLSMGGVIGIVAVMTKKEIFLVIVGGIFVMEVLSVIIQVVSFKTRGKRVFKMSPLHHHFELSGWPEQKVVARLWIMGIILAVIGLSTLKII
jgi:phospho-N-acetylmuramoyl-pentapeptide-transferase